jgi:hypothetical protein
MASSSDGLLVSLWRTSLISQDEAGTDPDGAGAQHKSCSNRLSIEDTTSSNNLHWLASHWAGLAFNEIYNSRDQNSCGNIASMSTSLTTLSTDNVHAEIEALLNMLGVSDHIHV